MRSWLLTTLLVLIPLAARADGLIDRLPNDGAWAEFDVTGKAVGADGQSRATIDGKLTFSSVGREEVSGEPCRWIEIKSQTRDLRGENRAETTGVLKLLLVERRLQRGQEPLAGIAKAWRQHPGMDDGKIKELDLKGEGLREVQSLDEFLHGPAWEVVELEALAVESKLGSLPCKGLRCTEVQKAGGAETRLTVIVRLNDQAPFGVVSYEYEKERLRDGRSVGKRTMDLKLVDFGENAASALPDSR